MAGRKLLERGHEQRGTGRIHDDAPLLVQQAEETFAQRAARGVGQTLKKGTQTRRTHGRGLLRLVHKIAAEHAHGKTMTLDELLHDGSKAEAPGTENIGNVNEGWHGVPLPQSPKNAKRNFPHRSSDRKKVCGPGSSKAFRRRKCSTEKLRNFLRSSLP